MKISGITLIALTVTIIVIFILVTISVNEGTRAIREAKFQTYETDLFSIKAKAKAYVEEVDAGTWSLSGDDKNNKKIELFRKVWYDSINDIFIK